jgi:hypothetical protein
MIAPVANIIPRLIPKPVGDYIAAIPVQKIIFYGRLHLS